MFAGRGVAPAENPYRGAGPGVRTPRGPPLDGQTARRSARTAAERPQAGTQTQTTGASAVLTARYYYGICTFEITSAYFSISIATATRCTTGLPDYCPTHDLARWIRSSASIAQPGSDSCQSKRASRKMTGTLVFQSHRHRVYCLNYRTTILQSEGCSHDVPAASRHPTRAVSHFKRVREVAVFGDRGRGPHQTLDGWMP